MLFSFSYLSKWGEVVKRFFSFIIILVVLFFNMSIISHAEGIDGKFIGTYKMEKIHIDHINEALKDLNLPISYSDDPEDYDAYPVIIRIFKDNRASLILDEGVVGSTNVTIKDDKIVIQFADSYWGYTDELSIKYTLEGIVKDNQITGIFYGIITQTGKLESEGTFEIKSGFGLNLLGSNDSGRR